MYANAIQTIGYSSLQTSSIFSLKVIEKDENANGSEAGFLSLQLSVYADFRINIQYSSGKEIHGQADKFELVKPKEFSFPKPDMKGIALSHAQDLISENGYFGIKQTSERIAEFVVNGAGDDIEKLKAGREGVLRGFKEAEKVWGGRLPEISYSTIEVALKQIDEKIYSLEGSIIDTTV